MNKMQLAEFIAGKNNLSVQEALAIIDVVHSAPIEVLVTGKATKVSVTGFGTFEKVWRKERVARNPHTGENFQMEGYWTVVFRPGRAFRDMVRGVKPLPTGRSAASKAPKSVRSRKAVAEALAASQEG